MKTKVIDVLVLPTVRYLVNFHFALHINELYILGAIFKTLHNLQIVYIALFCLISNLQ